MALDQRPTYLACIARMTSSPLLTEMDWVGAGAPAAGLATWAWRPHAPAAARSSAPSVRRQEDIDMLRSLWVPLRIMPHAAKVLRHLAADRLRWPHLSQQSADRGRVGERHVGRGELERIAHLFRIAYRDARGRPAPHDRWGLDRRADEARDADRPR